MVGSTAREPHAAAHLFVADLDRPEVDERDRHHLERVLRLRPGETVTVSDGAGRVRRCVLAPGLALEPTGEVTFDDIPAPAITIAFAPVKGDRPEWIVQKLTECGIDRIIPIHTDRSVVRWQGERGSRHVERLRTVAREAAMQSRRSRLPEILEPTTLAVASALPDAALADRGGQAPSLALPTVLVGPEGGWSDGERALGLPQVGLGPTVLRAETAALAAAVLLCGLRAGVVRGGASP